VENETGELVARIESFEDIRTKDLSIDFPDFVLNYAGEKYDTAD